MVKRIIIIGSHGMLGQDLVKVFEKDIGWEVFAFDRGEMDIFPKRVFEKKNR